MNAVLFSHKLMNSIPTPKPTPRMRHKRVTAKPNASDDLMMDRLRMFESSLQRVEQTIQRLDDRLWVAAYGCAAAGLACLASMIGQHLS